MSDKIKILFITYIHLGDAILNISILRYFIDKYPKSEVTVISGKSSQLIFQNFQCVKKTYPIIKDSLHLHWFKLWLKVFYKKWDIIVDCRGSNISRFLYAKQKYYKQDRSIKMHQPFSERMYNALGVTSLPLPCINIEISHDKKAAAILASDLNIPLITIAPIAGGAFKTWPLEHFIKLVDLIRSHPKFKNVKFLVTAAPHEYELCLPLLEHLKNNALSIIKEDILTTAACLKRSKLFIGNDSGLMHLASAVSTPVIGLYGPSDDRVYSPFSRSNSLVIRTPESYKELKISTRQQSKLKDSLMASLKPEKVFEEFCEFVKLI